MCERTEARERINFIRQYVRALESGTACIFAGAGLSIPSGGISWSELLKDDAAAIGIDVSKENDLISVAQYIYNTSGTKKTITSLLKNKINKHGKKNENHDIITKLPIKKIWTTNYDDYIENSYSENGKFPEVKRTIEDMGIEISESDVTIYKMHGDLGVPSSTVLLKDDYEIYDKKNEIFTKTLQSDLINNTFLFLGFSFDDPNLENILSKVRIMLEGQPRTHYCLMKKVSIEDPEFNDIVEKDVEFHYRANKQSLRVEDLKRYGIKAILIDSYDEITEILNEVTRKFLSKKVFISGAFHELKEFSNDSNELQKDAEYFCEKLSGKLLDNDVEISTGFGLGVGISIINGVIKREFELGNTRITNKLLVRPFPQSGSEEHKANHRDKILKECGISIFLFGNKLVNENIILSDGMQEEYSSALKNKHFTIPVGATGYKSEELWNNQRLKMKKIFGEESKTFKEFENLNNKKQSIDSLIDSIIFLVKEYNEKYINFNKEYLEDEKNGN